MLQVYRASDDSIIHDLYRAHTWKGTTRLHLHSILDHGPMKVGQLVCLSMGIRLDALLLTAI